MSADGSTCTGGCLLGELALAGPPGVTVCSPCDAGTYESGAECVACVHDASNCIGDGFAVAECGSGEGSDVSSCTNCTALGMFVSGDGSMCTGGCSLGEVVLAGPPGATVCSPCDAGTHQSGAECVACAHEASNCNGDGFVVAECGSGEASDVSSCTNCTALGMFVSGDGSMCTGGCSTAGEVASAGAPGEMVCVPCGADTYQSGVECEACAHNASNCNSDGLVFVGCGSGESSDVSTCTNCTALGMFVSGDGATCTGGCSTAGEVASAGAPGEMVCVPCGADTYQSGVECEACTHNASNCNSDGFAFVGCGSGESSDVSTCTNCTALGMFVSGDGAGCEGSCPEGQRPVAGTESTCAACAACPADQYASVVCTATEEHVCSACSGPTSCGSGEELVGCGAESTDVSMRECVACADDTFENGGVCEACTHDASNCNGDGFAFVGCGSGESSDVSTCTNCTALGMFVSGNGTTCEGMCSAGELPVGGPPGDTTCSPCPEDTYQLGAACVACEFNADVCARGFVVEVTCGSGETSDVSACTNCTAVGMFVSEDGASCVGSCAAGEVVVAGEPGEMECAACPRDTYGSGVECVGCANTSVTCSGPEVAVGRCGVGEVNDTSTCMNCTTVGLVPSRNGEACVTEASLFSDGEAEKRVGEGWVMVVLLVL